MPIALRHQMTPSIEVKEWISAPILARPQRHARPRSHDLQRHDRVRITEINSSWRLRLLEGLQQCLVEGAFFDLAGDSALEPPTMDAHMK